MAKHFFASLTRNGISLTGTALAAASLTLFIALIIIQWLGFEGGPYLGILTFLIIPALFALGLILIPIGIYFERRRLKKDPAYADKPHFPVIDLNEERTRKSVVIFLVITLINIVVLAGAPYKGVHVMETVEFCGQACHTVMEPEFTAYQRSAHAKVTCAECHIGAGADWFVKSKISGAWQLVAVAFDLYPTPIPTPLHNLRPSRETCEECHWPTKFVGDKLAVKTSYDDDEQNTEQTTALLLHIGGVESQGAYSGPDGAHGIHWHVDPSHEVRYLSSEDRETIYDIEFVDSDGSVKVFKNTEAEAPAEALERGWRTMECIDCHNRPTHRYRMPDEEINHAITDGRISRDLPYIKREGMRVLQADYPSHEAAREGIAAEIVAFYSENYPEIAVQMSDEVAGAGEALGQIWAWNVFPKMKVTWGTYPDHSGHQDNPGCFRCHNREHVSESGDKISRSCKLCHTVLANKKKDFDLNAALKD
ncbi:MAG: NapC/NirT family cytochrome c [Gammaproteobacteria bacterium]